MRLTTIRFPEDILEELEALAEAEGISVAAWVREAVYLRLAQDDPALREMATLLFEYLDSREEPKRRK